MGEPEVYGGVEGGGTHSTLMIFDKEGKKLVEVVGPSTNLYQIGMGETNKRIRDMVVEGLREAGLPPETQLSGLGLSLSGCERDETNAALVSDMVSSYPTLSSHYKVYFDHVDNLNTAPADTNKVQELIFSHFDIADRFGILTHCYDKFSKADFAGLSQKIAEAAIEGDALCAWLFTEAGRMLGRHIRALSRNIDSDLTSAEGGLRIVCVGSVWKSWELLKHGFLEGIKDALGRPCVGEVTMVQLSVGMATGAAYLGAREAGHYLPRNYGDNVQMFFHFTA